MEKQLHLLARDNEAADFRIRYSIGLPRTSRAAVPVRPLQAKDARRGSMIAL
jgi:hypothetical protein